MGNVDPAARAVCFWSWNGNLSHAEIRRQIEDFSQGKFGGIVIHARAGLTVPYMGEEWFDAYETALVEAERHGMEVWIYDENGWPSGFADGKIAKLGEEYWEKGLNCGRFGDIRENEEIVAAFRKTGVSSYERVRNGEYRAEDLAFWPVSDSGYVDLLNPKTVDQFLRFVHEPYKIRLGKWFGRVIRGFFTDEPGMHGGTFPWSPGLPERFEEAYGYSLLDSLWLLTVPGKGYKSFRCDFWTLLQALYRASYTKKIGSWCEENGLALTGHFACEDGLCEQIFSSGGVMPHYTHMQLPGIDHLGNRTVTAATIKQAASVAAQTGKAGVLSETFGCAGWGVYLERLAQLWGWQSALGITTPCFHLSAFTIEGRRKYDYPAFFSFQTPWWGLFPEFMKWMNGLNRLMREGERLTDILLLLPLTAMRAEFASDGPDRDRVRSISSRFRLLAENLLDLQLDFELGDETVMEEIGYVEERYFCVGKRKYSVVITPEEFMAGAKTAGLLLEYAAAGGNLLFAGTRPVYRDETPIPFPESCQMAVNRRDALEKWALYRGIERPVELRYRKRGGIVQNTAIHTRTVTNGMRAHIWNNNMDQSLEAVLSAVGKVFIARLDPATGERQSIPASFDAAAGRTEALVTLAAGEQLLIETSSDKKSYPARLSSPCRETRLIPDAVIPTDCNCYAIDQVRVAVNGGELSEEIPVVFAGERIYEAIERLHGSP